MLETGRQVGGEVLGLWDEEAYLVLGFSAIARITHA